MLGDAFSLVIIDKLPFAPPDDPVFATCAEHMEKQHHKTGVAFIHVI